MIIGVKFEGYIIKLGKYQQMISIFEWNCDVNSYPLNRRFSWCDMAVSI